MALAGTIGDFRASDYQTPGSASPWHPLTCSLLERAQRFSSAAGRVNRAQVERIIHELASAQGRAARPVIKWLEDPAEAFDHLSRYGLDALLRMGTASFWHAARPSIIFGQKAFDRSFDLRRLVIEILSVEDRDRALMAPKLLAKSEAMVRNASAAAHFQARAVAAQIGWLETNVAAVAAEAVSNVELLLSSGFCEHDERIHHQLRVFEAYEVGLLAMWETPAELICVPRNGLV
jgi:hypothetical protein